MSDYVRLANSPDKIGVCISIDEDDSSMTRNLVREEVLRILKPCAWKTIWIGNNKTKIQAANADIEKVDWSWDIVVLVSDDMRPQVKGWDDVLRTHMTARFPDTDGILWCNDGAQGDKLNTLSVLGRTMYQRMGYIYHPDYKSLFCDTEFTDQCKGVYASKCLYIPHCIIRHEHPFTGFESRMDALYQRNQVYWREDMMTYIRRKQYEFDWSILIPTMTGREGVLAKLLASLHEKSKRICPSLKLSIDLLYDERGMSIGTKRNTLKTNAKGKYVSFIDDDDEVTDAYFEDALSTIAGQYDVCRLRGQIGTYTFTHSLRHTPTSPMAEGGVLVRPPNHLNLMLTDVGRYILFRDSVRGEDLDWTIRLAQTGWFVKEFQSNADRIHYIYNTRDVVDQETYTYQTTMTPITMLPTLYIGKEQLTPQQPTGLRFTSRGFVSS